MAAGCFDPVLHLDFSFWEERGGVGELGAITRQLRSRNGRPGNQNPALTLLLQKRS